MGRNLIIWLLSVAVAILSITVFWAFVELDDTKDELDHAYTLLDARYNQMLAAKIAYVHATTPFSPIPLIEQMMDGEIEVFVNDGSFATVRGNEGEIPMISIVGANGAVSSIERSMLPRGPIIVQNP